MQAFLRPEDKANKKEGIYILWDITIHVNTYV